MIKMKIIKPIDLNKFLKNNKEKDVEENKTLTDISEKIKEAQNIAIFTHESPDGDAIGSTLSVYLALKQIGKEAKMYIPEYSRLFNFLPGASEIKNKLDDEEFDLAISVDCANLKRLVGKEYFENAKETIVIDHHESNDMYGDINYVDSAAPACAQILVSILQYYNVEITQELGTTLLTGIITDTGGFKHQGITPETFEFAAELLRKGVDVSTLYSKVLETRTRANFELSKRVSERMEFLEDGKIAFTYITKQDEIETNAEPGDHEGLVEIARSIEGVEVSVFIRQRDDEEYYKVSMRSKNNINVSDICYLFGGGGHIRAAGCLIKGDVEKVKEKIIKETKKAFQ